MILGCNGQFRDSTDDFRLQRPTSDCNGRFQVATAEFGFQWPISGCNGRFWISMADFRLKRPQIPEFSSRALISSQRWSKQRRMGFS